MVFGPSALNRVYNYKRVCPGPVLDRVWLEVDCSQSLIFPWNASVELPPSVCKGKRNLGRVSKLPRGALVRVR